MERPDIEYGRADGQILRLDAHLPPGAGPFPAVIVVHGGGWVAGDRRWNVESLFRPLLEAGFACFSISCRPAKHMLGFGAAVEDVEQAVRHVRDHAPELNVDSDRTVLLGESAGGQLAAMAALENARSAVKAVVGLYAPMDLEQLARSSTMVPEPLRQTVQGTPWAGTVLRLPSAASCIPATDRIGVERLRALSPIRHLRSGMPPFLLIHGTADMLVPFEQSQTMCRAIPPIRSVAGRQLAADGNRWNAGGECDLIAVKGGGHGLRWWESAGLTGYKRLMTAWRQKRA